MTHDFRCLRCFVGVIVAFQPAGLPMIDPGSPLLQARTGRYD
jgi:hypothetical protein